MAADGAQRRLVRRGGDRLGGRQERAANDDTLRAERERGGHTATVGHATGCQYRYIDGVDDLRNQGEGSEEGILSSTNESHAVTGGLHAARDDRVNATRGERTRLGNVCGCSDDPCTNGVQRFDRDRIGHAIHEARDGGARLNDGGELLVKRREEVFGASR